MSQPVQDRERTTLSFCVQNLASRDELLLKSIVRLLSHRSRHTWLYVPHVTGNPAADLVISGERTPAVLGTSQQGLRQSLLILGAVSRTNCPAYLCMPLRADELERELNLLGDFITHHQATAKVPNRAAAKGLDLPSGATAQTSLGNSQLTPPLLTLLRWPTADLISTRERLRMATMMISQPLTLPALVQRAGLDPAVCKEFVDDLNRAGLLRNSSANTQSTASGLSAQPKPLPTVQSGLFARIRSRLGLQLFGK